MSVVPVGIAMLRRSMQAWWRRGHGYPKYDWEYLWFGFHAPWDWTTDDLQEPFTEISIPPGPNLTVPSPPVVSFVRDGVTVAEFTL